MLPSEPVPTTPGGAGAARRRVGYVVKCYPRFSETFVVREILAREAQGEDLVVASLRAPTDGRFHRLVAEVTAPVTWIEPGGRSARRLWETLAAALGRPGAPGLPGLPATLPALLAEDVEVAEQALRLALWARDAGVTHLHAHFASLPARTTRLAAACAGLTYSLTAHAKDIFHVDVDREALAAVLRDASHVVTVSAHNVAHLLGEHPDLAGRLHLVHNGLPLADLPWSDPRPRPRTVAAVGRLVEKKGFDVLLDALALMRGAGDDVRLLLAGTGRCEADLRARAAAAGLDGAVTFLGALPQHGVVDLLRGAAVFAAPCVVAADGDRDGLPTVLLEAMALGTPCVSTPVTGIPEVVRDGETGLLVPERDAAALAAALTRLLDDGGLRARLSRAARRLVEDEFDVAGQAAALRHLETADPVAATAPIPSHRPVPATPRAAEPVGRPPAPAVPVVPAALEEVPA